MPAQSLAYTFTGQVQPVGNALVSFLVSRCLSKSGTYFLWSQLQQKNLTDLISDSPILLARQLQY